MEVKVFILPGGELQILVDGDGVTFAEAAAETERVLAALGAAGLDVKRTSAIEQHKPDGISHVHLHQNVQH